MSLSAAIRDPLRKIGEQADGDINLAEAALAIAAADRPRAGLEPYRRHLAQMAQEVAVHAGSSRGASDLDGQIEALSHVVCRRYGYGCDAETFDEMEAANLMRVIDSRRGLPVVLGILYIHAARAQGWTMAGLDFPLHFLVRLEHAGERRILDPASGLRVMEPAELRALLKAAAGNEAELAPAHYAAMDNRAILYRMQNNVKIRQLRTGQLEDALQTIETMALFAPDAAELWREAGLVNARLDNFGAAVTALEEFLRRGGDPAARREAQELLQRLRARLN